MDTQSAQTVKLTLVPLEDRQSAVFGQKDLGSTQVYPFFLRKGTKWQIRIAPSTSASCAEFQPINSSICEICAAVCLLSKPFFGGFPFFSTKCLHPKHVPFFRSVGLSCKVIFCAARAIIAPLCCFGQKIVVQPLLGRWDVVWWLT